MLVYFLSKLIPLIFQPIGITFLFLIIYLRYKKNFFLYTAIFTLWILSTHITAELLIGFVESPWQQLSIASIEKADAIVVLSGGLQPVSNKTIKQEWQDPDRFFYGVDLLKAKKASSLIFTSGIRPLQNNVVPESRIYLEKALEIGVPKNKILITKFAKNTSEEAQKVRELFKNNDELGSSKIILVTSAFHMWRAKKIFERNNFQVISFPVDFKKNDYKNNMITFFIKVMPNSYDLSRSSLAIREIMGRIIYRVF